MNALRLGDGAIVVDGTLPFGAVSVIEMAALWGVSEDEAAARMGDWPDGGYSDLYQTETKVPPDEETRRKVEDIRFWGSEDAGYQLDTSLII